MKSIIAFAMCIACATLAQSFSHYPGLLRGLACRDPYVYNGLGSVATKYQAPNVAPYLQSTSCGGCGSCSECKGLYEPSCGGCGSCSSCKKSVGYGCGGCGSCASCRGVRVPSCGGCGSCSACRGVHVPSCGGCGSCTACKGHQYQVVYSNH